VTYRSFGMAACEAWNECSSNQSSEPASQRARHLTLLDKAPPALKDHFLADA
jgi:hypothetical protein